MSRTDAGPRPGRRRLVALVGAGFGGFFVHGGGALELPLPFSLADLPTLRAIGDQGQPGETAQGEPAIEQEQRRAS